MIGLSGDRYDTAYIQLSKYLLIDIAVHGYIAGIKLYCACSDHAQPWL